MSVVVSSETTYLVLDIETIPDRELFTPPEPAAGVERPFPPLYACRPVVIGVMWLDEDLGVKRIGTIGEGKDEAGMMADFADFMGKWRPHLVTWNGRGFDLPVLALRALRFGLDFRWYYRGEGYRYRFTEEGHLDLCDVLSDHGAAQDDVARRRGAHHRPAGQGRRRRQPGRGALQRRPDRGAAALLPVRRRADGVPVPALPAGRGRSRPRRLPARRQRRCSPRWRPTGGSAGCSTASTGGGCCSSD